MKNPRPIKANPVATQASMRASKADQTSRSPNPFAHPKTNQAAAARAIPITDAGPATMNLFPEIRYATTSTASAIHILRAHMGLGSSIGSKLPDAKLTARVSSVFTAIESNSAETILTLWGCANAPSKVFGFILGE
jgi:hypothetical protein